MLLQLASSDITCMRVWSAATLLFEQTGVAVNTYSCTREVPHPTGTSVLTGLFVVFLKSFQDSLGGVD